MPHKEHTTVTAKLVSHTQVSEYRSNNMMSSSLQYCHFCCLCLLGAVVKQEIKSCGLTAELIKKQLQSKAEKSLVAQRALSQWNRMNTTIREIVNNMQERAYYLFSWE